MTPVQRARALRHEPTTPRGALLPTGLGPSVGGNRHDRGNNL